MTGRSHISASGSHVYDLLSDQTEVRSLFNLFASSYLSYYTTRFKTSTISLFLALYKIKNGESGCMKGQNPVLCSAGAKSPGPSGGSR